MRSTWRVERANIEVTQIVEIVPGPQSSRYDTCLIHYTIDNKDTQPHTVGIRFLLDTYIGDNDGVPFTIPGDAGLCDTLKVFNSPDQVPDYIQALEKPDLRHPGTVWKRRCSSASAASWRARRVCCWAAGRMWA